VGAVLEMPEKDPHLITCIVIRLLHPIVRLFDFLFPTSAGRTPHDWNVTNERSKKKIQIKLKINKDHDKVSVCPTVTINMKMFTHFTSGCHVLCNFRGGFVCHKSSLLLVVIHTAKRNNQTTGALTDWSD
jgi:hypothetical protein